MADVIPQTEDWQTLPWQQFQRNVYRLQKRILRLRSGQVLPSRTPWRLQARPQSATATASVAIGAVSGCTPSHARQPR